MPFFRITFRSKFCLTEPKNFVGEPHYGVSENFGYRKFYASERGGGYHVSLSKTFVTVPKNFVGEHFCVSKKFWYRKFSSKGGGSFTVSSKFFHLTGPKKLRQGTILCFRKFLVGKKFLWIRGWGGGVRVSRFSVENFRRGTP